MEKILITCSFGLEAVIKHELLDLGYEDINVNDGMITLLGAYSDIAKLNINLRAADRIYLVIDEFMASDFEQLFVNVEKIAWYDLLKKDDNFIINARSYKSKLASLRSIQSVSEKAIIKSLQKKYKISHFKKDGSRIKIEVMIEKNKAIICLDTSGEGLHKRGYRVDSVKAPLRENLAAALVDLSFYEPSRFLLDPFAGSGTILIEAARKARNIAPGIDRDFDFQNFDFLDDSYYKNAKKDALSKIDYSLRLNILGADISGRAVMLAKENALNAGVSEDITFIQRDISSVAVKNDYGIVISNPPYGKRLSRIDMDEIYRKMNEKFLKLDTYSLYFISGDTNFPRKFKKKLSRKRKLYNGGDKVEYFQYLGARPPRS